MGAYQRPILAANWKMNHGPTAASAFLASFLDRYARRDDRTVILFPSALAFAAAQSAVAERPDILLGVQNINAAEKGAFTGENSAAIALDAGAGFGGVSAEALRDAIVAYEPVWAIGTGRTATPQDASAAHQAIRAELRAIAGETGSSIPILYGGRANAANAAALLAAPGVDGLLVGGASLEAESWTSICNAGG